MKKIIAFARKRQDAILNTVFVAGLLLLVWVGIRVLLVSDSETGNSMKRIRAV